VKWLRSKKARFYLYQPAHNVWMTHFRVDDPKKTQETPDWILFEMIDNRPRQVRLGLKVDWPTRVPGL
jgi:hypothetical protein